MSSGHPRNMETSTRSPPERGDIHPVNKEFQQNYERIKNCNKITTKIEKYNQELQQKRVSLIDGTLGQQRGSEIEERLETI